MKIAYIATGAANMYCGSCMRDNDRSPVIGYLARISPEKRLHILVEAFIHLCRTSFFQLSKLASRFLTQPKFRDFPGRSDSGG
jgi:glycosyltransferase involved in cell wall biosynthesis